jgi:D-galactonate transporter
MNPSVTRSAMQPPPVSDAATEAVYAKISRRIVPILILAYFIAFLDRVNISYAQLQMKQTLPWGETVYGIGAGIFFLGYFLFEVPSNLLLEKIGARKTLLRIMLLWGVTAASMMFVSTPTQFYAARFLLGAFEAGFFPGVVLYFTYWYPSHRRGKVIALFMTATVIAGIVSGPVSGTILKYFDGAGGLHGWQWLFLVEGLPAAVIGLVVFFVLDDKPDHAKWLTDAEKNVVRDGLAHDEKDIESEGDATALTMLRDFRVWALSLVYFLALAGTYILVFWMPTLIHSWHIKDLQLVGILVAIPNAVGAVGMVLIGASSDRRHERRWHYVAAIAIACVGLLVTAWLNGNVTGSIIALSLAVCGVASLTPLTFAIVSEYLSVRSAAAGLALISSLGNLGPSVSPSINAIIVQRTGDPAYSLYFIVLVYILSALLLITAIRPAKKHPQNAR